MFKKHYSRVYGAFFGMKIFKVNYFQSFNKYKTTAQVFLRSQIDPSNFLGIRSFADTHSCKDLFKLAEKYFHNNFVDVIETNELLLLIGRCLSIG